MEIYTNELKEQMMTFYNIGEYEVDELLKGASPFCKCGKFKKIAKYPRSKIGIRYSNCGCGAKECNPNYGKKRPKQSEIMKGLVINGSEAFKATLMKKGQLFNKDVNNPIFKKKLLEKKGIDCEGLNDFEIEGKFTIYAGGRQKNVQFRKRQILKRYSFWEDEFKILILLVTEQNIPTENWLS